MADQTIIHTESLTKIYGMGEIQVKALDGVDLEIRENEFVAVMGPSGSGKSTLMNILGCLDRPTEGRYILAGEDISGLSKSQLARIRNQRIGFVFQSYNLLPNTTALENVMLPMIYNRNNGHQSAVEQKEKALAMLELVNLSDRIHHHPKELSGGQMQRVAIARALINDPVLILADEPTGNLDSKAGQEIMGLMRDLHSRGSTIVMVTHENDIAAHAQRVIHFRDGHIESDQLNGHKTPHPNLAQEANDASQ
ncbi:MAG: putative transporter ATP-binding protein [Chloroflexi bacterium]|nr:putative transporter ATP-binding protein [Chloroflexota bacterium]